MEPFGAIWSHLETFGAPIISATSCDFMGVQNLLKNIWALRFINHVTASRHHLILYQKKNDLNKWVSVMGDPPDLGHGKT